MRKNRAFYVLGLGLGIAGVFVLIPEARERASVFASQTARRVREAWQEGKAAKRRREHELEAEVLGLDEGEEEPEAPDYIV